jgi:hypothetical protein
MLLMSLALVVIIAYQVRDSNRPRPMRIAGVVSIIVTLGLVVWSIVRFGF